MQDLPEYCDEGAGLSLLVMSLLALVLFMIKCYTFYDNRSLLSITCLKQCVMNKTVQILLFKYSRVHCLVY